MTNNLTTQSHRLFFITSDNPEVVREVYLFIRQWSGKLSFFFVRQSVFRSIFLCYLISPRLPVSWWNFKKMAFRIQLSGSRSWYSHPNIVLFCFFRLFFFFFFFFLSCLTTCFHLMRWNQYERKTETEMNSVIISLNVQNNHHDYLHTAAYIRSISRRSFYSPLDEWSSWIRLRHHITIMNHLDCPLFWKKGL